MKGWILFNKRQEALTANDHELTRLFAAAATRGITLSVFTPDQFSLISPPEDHDTVLIDGAAHQLPDFAFSYLGAKADYSTVAILHYLAERGVNTINPVHAITRALDKWQAHQHLQAQGVKVPRTMLLGAKYNIKLIDRYIGFPLVVKPTQGMGGQGIVLCNNEQQLADIVGLVRLQKSSPQLIVQQFITTSAGKDVRVLVVNGKVVGSMMRSSTKGFKANYACGGTPTPYPLTPKMEKLALEVARVTELTITGIDLLLTDNDDEYLVCEANSSPGFRGLESIVGPVVAEAILACVK